MGADVVIDYEEEDYVQAVMRETAGQGVDVVFDTIGGDALACSPDVLAQLGRLVSIVDIAQPQNLINARGKNASYHFVFTRQNRCKFDELRVLVERGQLRPHVGATYSLALILLLRMLGMRVLIMGCGGRLLLQWCSEGIRVQYIPSPQLSDPDQRASFVAWSAHPRATVCSD